MSSLVNSSRKRTPVSCGRFLLAASLVLSAFGLAGAGRASTAQYWPVTGFELTGHKPIFPVDLNNNGTALGVVQIGTTQAYQGAICADSGVQLMALPDGVSSVAPYAINNNNDVVGYYYKGTLPHAFLYRAGAYTDLSDQLGDTTGVATDINDAGEIVGIGTHGGFALMPSGDHIALGLGVQPLNINSAGHMVGLTASPQGFFYFADANHDLMAEPNEIVPLTLPAGSQIQPIIRLNDNDLIAGTYSDSGGQGHAVTWANGQAGTNPTELPGSPGQGVGAQDVNNAGDVVGLALIPAAGGGTRLANVVWPRGGTPLDIMENTVDGPGNPQVQSAFIINTGGQVLGSAYIQGGPPYPTAVIIDVHGAGSGPQAKLTNLAIPGPVTAGKDLKISYATTQVLSAPESALLEFFSGNGTSGTPVYTVPLTIKPTSATSKKYSAILPAQSSTGYSVAALLSSLPSNTSVVSAFLVGNGGLGITNTVNVKVTVPPTPQLTKLLVTPNPFTASDSLSIKTTFTQVVASGTQVTMNFYEGGSVTGSPKYSFPITFNTTGSSKTYSASLPATGQTSVATLLAALSPSATQTTAQVVGSGSLGQTPPVTLNISRSAAALAITAASLSPTTIHKSTTKLTDIQLSVTLNRALLATEKKVVLDVKVTGPDPRNPDQLITVPLPVTLKRVEGQTTYVTTGDKIKNLNQITGGVNGSYHLEISYNGGTSFTQDIMLTD